MQKTRKKCLVFAGRLLVCIGSMLWILSGCGESASGGLTKFGESSLYESSVQGEASDSSLKEEESEAFDTSDDSSSQEKSSDALEDDDGVIFVHLCGAVKEPGVYEVESGSRLYEVLKRAGGLTEEACDTFLNQAQLLTDGSQIYVPTKEEVANGSLENPANSQGQVAETAENATSQTKDSSKAKVNINTADVSELMTLSGIGESKAKAIVEYRESNGAFKSIEELMNISGIKEGVFQKIKDSITV